MYKVLKVGIRNRGFPFGNITINRTSKSNPMSMRVLSQNIADITKLIQGGGTKGPYLWRQIVPREESDTGYGYVFAENYDYAIIENNS